jgi:cyclopropane fatty-acyl-phospholipid synthase-like methyltransferase
MKEAITEVLRGRFLRFTRAAFASLPKMERPRVLELGCGSGAVTIELAGLTDGEIIAIDIDESLLNRLNEKLARTNITGRVTARRMDLLQNDFPEGYFDIVWEEGVVHVIGFRESFEACHRILRIGGYFVLGQAIKAMDKHQELITRCGFKLVRRLDWTEGCWWTEYYQPLETLIEEARAGKNGLHFLKDIDVIEAEIRMVKAHPRESDCAHYVLRKG